MAPAGGKNVKKGILERLNSGEVIIGDGGFVFALEKRGYVKAGPWTPEAAVEHPEAVRQLHREFLRAGSNVMQTFTFYASEDKLENRGNYVAEKISGQKVNEAACDIARQVADEGDALVAGGVSQTPSYLSCKSETEVKKVFQQQLEVFVKKNVDFLIAEYFEHVEEAVWAVEALKASGKPVAATMCIGPEGDLHSVTPGECAVRLVKAGASIVGVNCHFDPTISLQTVKLMKEGLEAAGLKAHLMSQPLAYHTPDCGKQGFIDLPEFPFGLEPRVATRWDIQKYAREAYNLGVRYIAVSLQAPHQSQGAPPQVAGVGPGLKGNPSHQALFQVVNRLGLDSLSPFNPKERIIEYLVSQDGPEQSLVDQPLRAFIRAVGARSAAPGGGSVAAASAAMGAALASMAGLMTYGRRQFEHLDVTMRRLIPPFRAAVAELTAMVDADARAFEAYLKATKLPKNTPEDKDRRAAALQEGLRQAVAVPLALAETVASLWPALRELALCVNLACRSDLQVAAKALETGVFGAYFNVLINLKDVTDDAFKDQVRRRISSLLQDAQTQAALVLDGLEARQE